MGDRANIYVTENLDTPGVYLYSHWGGRSLPLVLQRALRRHWRWDDISYLTRIIFCEMVQGDERSETGYGIGTDAPDNERPLMVVCTEDQTVHMGVVPFDKAKTAEGIGFDEFCSLSDKDLMVFTGREEESEE